ncbi:hypothetical protein EDC59_113123 [Pseudodesulfovibrio indicus]|jgi:hypothetical protein|uniref:Uncharacterized protein n=2 Tax=Desulfovibrionaceae TaxID=194924 RepID=A0A140D8T9_9BACT|nr:hypothetical protein AWY79_00035 [Pseudodesulfovibrio indicus]TDT86447.1 hypothetical protein EDC59_113123 [Pseudodesulfovibrio indicus]
MMTGTGNNGKEEKRGEINGMSYGKLMTSLLIPKDSRTNPKRILSGIAFLAFVCFFLFGTLSRGCVREAQQQPPVTEQPAGVQ